ncbi:xanthine dehydrogenase/oxidase-like [Amphiura filiformis]|uniref:xanthine dehydrogenase/oxidase-like n=1 Tax=Amphiura filiformis TaxID=82378 RepID=UPI003B227E07
MSDELYDVTKFTEYDPTQDVIFPPELLTNNSTFLQSTQFTKDQLTWINAGNIEDFLSLKSNNPKAVIIAGNTAAPGASHNLEGVVIYTGQVSQLNSIELTETGLKVGASVTMSMLQNAIKLHCKTLSSDQALTLQVIQQALQQYASCQIRNVATIGGHLVAPKSDYDLVPLIMAVGAKAFIVDTDGNVCESTLNGSSYSSDDRLVKYNEILQYIEIPFTSVNEHVEFYKMSHKRYYLDNAVVTAAFCMTFEPESDVVRDGCLVFGGIRKLPVFADATMKKLIGRTWNTELLESTCASLKEDLQSDIDASGKDQDYCSNLVVGSFFKFFFKVLKSLEEKQVTSSTPLPATPEFGSIPSKVPCGSALFQPAPKDQPNIDSIGRPIVHRSALQQTSGEAVYVDDLPPVQGELYLAFVLPSRGRARVLSTNLAAAQEVDGYVTYVNADDITGINRSTLDDDEILVTKEVYSTGAIIGAIVATTPEAAHKAAKLVHVSYEDLPVITTIEVAHKAAKLVHVSYEDLPVITTIEVSSLAIIGAIVATTPEVAHKAAKLVHVSYEDLPVITTIEVSSLAIIGAIVATTPEVAHKAAKLVHVSYEDLPVIATIEVSSLAIIGAIVATTPEVAHKAAKLVHVSYEDLPVITTIEVSSLAIIGAVVATTPEAAHKAAKLVHVSYEDLPVITTIEVSSLAIIGAIVATTPEVAHKAAKLVHVSYEDLPVITTIEVSSLAIIGAIVATTPEVAHKAAKLVHVSYEDLPVITTIEVSSLAIIGAIVATTPEVAHKAAKLVHVSYEDLPVITTIEVSSLAIIGAIVATTPEVAHKAAKLVHVSYEDLPVITTIEEAIEQEAFHQPTESLQKGDVEKGFDQSSVVLEGTIRTAAQEHYYMEPTACIAKPSGEAGEIEMITCFQEINSVQCTVAKALGVDANKVNVKTKRAGGSFGGKSNQCNYMAVCALAAQKTGKAVRMVLPRGTDIQITGHREGSMAKYKVGFENKTGKINSLDITVYINWGSPSGIHFAIFGQVLFSLQGVYAMDNIHTMVKNCATNIPATKPMRTFGIVQSVFIIESIITDIALKCGLPVLQVREVNMHKEDIPTTYYGVPIEGFDVFRRCWKECLDKSDYHNRRNQVNNFNRKSESHCGVEYTLQWRVQGSFGC